MRLKEAIERRERKAAFYAGLGKAKAAARELRKANELRTAGKIQREIKQERKAS